MAGLVSFILLYITF